MLKFTLCLIFILDKQEDSSDDDEAEEGEVEDENSSDVEVSNRAAPVAGASLHVGP